MKVDLYTDAGVKDGLATWGCVLVVDKVQIFEAHGQMRDPTICSLVAEMRCVGNALHTVIKAKLVEPGWSVRLICDHARVVGLIKGKVTITRKRKVNLDHAAALAVVRRITEKAGIELTAIGVKGHQPLDSTDPHAPHNRRCDQLCRIARGETVGEPRPRSPHGQGTSPAARKRRAKREAAQQGAGA